MEDEQKISIMNAVFELRFLFLLETAPQSNKYHQLLLTERQYQMLNVYIKSFFPPCSDPSHGHQLPCNVVPLENKFDISAPEEIRPHYPQEYIDLK